MFICLLFIFLAAADAAPLAFMVHRLDRDTSGVQIVAKTKAAAAAFMKVRLKELEIDHEWRTSDHRQFFALSWDSAPTSGIAT
jgi:hypothetical protein